MKRILCILSSLDAGGAETFLMKINRALKPEDYQMDFIVSVDGGCYKEEVISRGGRINKIPKRTEDFIGAFRAIEKVVKLNNYDTVLKLAENSLSVADMIAAKLGGAKNLVVRSCNAPTNLTFKEKFIHYAIRPLLNLITTVRLAPSDLASDFMFGKNREVHLINNGVDLDVFHFDKEGREQIRKEFGIENKLVIGHVGRYTKQKNHRHLLNVFKEISKVREDAVLMLVGKGELEEEIKNQIAELKLTDKVILTGLRFDIPQILSAMDLFVFPSFHEGMPNTVIEAQATGLPCIIADTITKEADITGLVKYLPLEETPEFWAKTILDSKFENRRLTKDEFVKHGYDIKTVANNLMGLICN